MIGVLDPGSPSTIFHSLFYYLRSSWASQHNTGQKTSLLFKILGYFLDFMMLRGNASPGGLGCPPVYQPSQNLTETKSPPDGNVFPPLHFLPISPKQPTSLYRSMAPWQETPGKRASIIHSSGQRCLRPWIEFGDFHRTWRVRT